MKHWASAGLAFPPIIILKFLIINYLLFPRHITNHYESPFCRRLRPSQLKQVPAVGP